MSKTSMCHIPWSLDEVVKRLYRVPLRTPPCGTTVNDVFISAVLFCPTGSRSSVTGRGARGLGGLPSNRARDGRYPLGVPSSLWVYLPLLVLRCTLVRFLLTSPTRFHTLSNSVIPSVT